MGLPILMSSFFKIPKQVCKRLDLDCDFFGRVMVIRGNIDSPVGILFVGQKTKGGLEVNILELKNKCLLIKWFFNLLNEQGRYGKSLLQINTSSPKFYLKSK
jgi:hypothetical protein